jgi:3-dehydroquinate dehydratase
LRFISQTYFNVRNIAIIPFFSDIAVGCIIGLGAQGYQLAMQAAIKHVGTRD